MNPKLSLNSSPHPPPVAQHTVLATLAQAPRKDIEALVEANKVALSGLRVLARKQAQSVRKSTRTICESAAVVDPAKRVHVLREWQAAASADLAEIGLLLGNCHADAMAHLTQRAYAYSRQFRGLMQMQYPAHAGS